MAAHKSKSSEFAYGMTAYESNESICHWFSLLKKRGLQIFFSKDVFVTIQFVIVKATQKLQMKIFDVK